MLRYVLYDLTLFAPADNVEQTRKDLLWLLEGLVQRNQDYLKQRPSTPRLYKSGVKWTAPNQLDGEPPEITALKKALGKAARSGDVKRALDKYDQILSSEHFCDIGRILELGGIDCDGLASWRVAELRQMGIKADPYLKWRDAPGGGTIYHALVLWPPFGSTAHRSTEDPSLLLGMHQPERASDRAEEIRKNAERCADIKRMGRGALRADFSPALDRQIEDILGLNGRDSAFREVERMLRQRATRKRAA